MDKEDVVHMEYYIAIKKNELMPLQQHGWINDTNKLNYKTEKDSQT